MAPARVVPQKALSPIGQVLGPLRELPFCLRGAWDFGDLRPDLSLASEPAWQVRWLVRLCRPRARLGGSAPRDGDLRDGPGYGFRWLVRVGRPRARLGDPPPRRGPPRRARLRTT